MEWVLESIDINSKKANKETIDNYRMSFKIIS